VRSRLLLLLSLGLGFVCPASSGIVTFTDRQAWASTSPGLTTIDFVGLGGSTPGSDQGYLSGLTDDGVTFNGIDGNDQPYLYVRSADISFGLPDFLFGPPNRTDCFPTGCFPGTPGSGIVVELPAGVTAVGWDFANFYESGDYGNNFAVGLEVDFTDGTIYSSSYIGGITSWSGGPLFVGFTSSAPIDSFEIMGPGFPTVENFSFGGLPTTTSVTPEPSSLSLEVAGVAVLGVITAGRQGSRRIRKG